MAEKQFGVRLSAEGGDKVRAELLGIGQVGQEAFQDVADAANRSRRPIEEVGERAARVGQRAGMGSHGLRQFSLQLNQVAQSGAVTGQWVQALAVQLPDMLLAFGTAGAVAGTLAAVLIPLGTSLLKVATAGRDVEGALDKAEDSLKAFARAADNSATSWADLVKTYGAAADEVERLHRVQLEAARSTAMQDLLSVGDALGGMAAERRVSADRYAGSLRGEPGAIEGWLAYVRAMQQRYHITREEAVALAVALRKADKAGSFEEALPAATDLIELLKDAGITSGDLWDRANRMADIAKGGIAAVNEELGKTIAISREGQQAVAGFLGGLASRATQWLTGKTPGALASEWTAGSKGILDLIGWAEGTDKGRGYNETLGYGAFTGGPVNLTSMTISQVRDLQRQMLAHPANHYNSSAVGRYQIVGTTLERLVRQLGISGDEMFDEKMQDRLAMELVRGRMGGGVEGWYSEWEGLRSKGVGISTITGALGQKSVGVDPAIAKQNEEWQRNLDLRQDWLTGIDAQVKAAALEAQAIGKSTYEIAYQRAEMRLTQELQAKGISLTERLNGGEKTYGQLVQETAHALAASAQETEVLQGRQTDLITTMEENAQRMRQFREDFVGDFTSAFAGVIDGTKKVGVAFGDMLKSMAARWAEAGLNKLGGWLFDSLFGGMGVVSAFTGDPLAGALSAVVMHEGGTVGEDSATTRRVHPGVFLKPRSQRSPMKDFLDLRPDEVPAILQRGERVLSRAELARADAGDLSAMVMHDGGKDEVPAILQRGERMIPRDEVEKAGKVLSAIVMHDGGTVGEDSTQTRRAHPAAFLGAERYHSGGWPGLQADGGDALSKDVARQVHPAKRRSMADLLDLRSDEVPAILQRGERVLSRAELARADAGALSAIVMHEGGTVGEAGMSRQVHPAVFAGAQRYHSGGWPGLRSDEVPAVLQRGERVQSRAEVAMNGGASTIKLLLSPGLIAEVLEKARGQSVQVVKEHTPGIVQRAIDTSVRVNSETGMYA